MAKQYNTVKATFVQKDYEKVVKYLDDDLREAFKKGVIDLKWCKNYCIPYIMKLIENGKYNVGQVQEGKRG